LGCYGKLTHNREPVPIGAVVSDLFDGNLYATDVSKTTPDLNELPVSREDNPGMPRIKKGGVPGDLIILRMYVDEGWMKEFS
jgi:hypothetical protein